MANKIYVKDIPKGVWLMVAGIVVGFSPVALWAVMAASSPNNCGGAEGCATVLWGLLVSMPIGAGLFLGGLIWLIVDLARRTRAMPVGDASQVAYVRPAADPKRLRLGKQFMIYGGGLMLLSWVAGGVLNFLQVQNPSQYALFAAISALSGLAGNGGLVLLVWGIVWYNQNKPRA